MLIDPQNPVILIIIAILSSGTVSIMIKKYFPSKDEDTNYWTNLTNGYKNLGQDYYGRLEILEKKVETLEDKIRDLESDVKLLKFKYKIAINFAKDLLKFIKSEEYEGEIPFIPSEIEDDFSKKED